MLPRCCPSSSQNSCYLFSGTKNMWRRRSRTMGSMLLVLEDIAIGMRNVATNFGCCISSVLCFSLRSIDPWKLCWETIWCVYPAKQYFGQQAVATYEKSSFFLYNFFLYGEVQLCLGATQWIRINFYPSISAGCWTYILNAISFCPSTENTSFFAWFLPALWCIFIYNIWWRGAESAWAMVHTFCLYGAWCSRVLQYVWYVYVCSMCNGM